MKFKRLRIAVVDDEVHVRRALERLMRGVGFDVVTHASAADFLASLAEQPPDCLVLDLNMPGQGGIELQEAMNARGLHVPTVVITGHDNGTAKSEAMAGGAFAYLRKPVDGQELVAAITRAVARVTL